MAVMKINDIKVNFSYLISAKSRNDFSLRDCNLTYDLYFLKNCPHRPYFDDESYYNKYK